MRIRLYWLFIFLGITAVAFFGYQHFQEPISYDFASEFDGNDYRNIYEYFTGMQSEFEVAFPFHQRILVPVLASLINSGDVLFDFQVVNLIFTLLSVWITFLLWRQLGFELKWFIAGFIWLLFHWTGLIRLNAFDPITVDVPLYFFQALFIWLLLKRKFIHLLWLAPIAAVQKESFIALLIVLMVYAWWHNLKTQEGFYDLPLIAASLVLSVVANSLVNGNLPPTEAGKGALITLGYHAKEAILNPFELVRWLAAMAMAFGPALFIAFGRYTRSFRYDNTRNLLILFSLVYLAFGILAGGDMTRIIYLGFPFIATWIIYELREVRTKQLLIIGLFSLPLMMLFSNIPNPAFEWDAWQSWYPEFTESGIVLVVLSYVLVMAFILNRMMRSSVSK
ncbi:hypothetical protein [Roseivirga sp. E12]|uniref:hypothetical protein n=1 Tax=Roseivirga sp. E12 TaxID=2819237 RepID=UPI001ABC844B|nr:hypothetical protein [Roseivirga sp. E12]MBO3700024.1 hypothetical protein [Roseivirga sp. E12]